MPRKKVSPKSASTQEQAVCYTRVSTHEQANFGVSLEAQEKRLLGYCQMLNLEIVEILKEEGVSGAKELSSRPKGKRLLELVQQKKVNHIVAVKLDRLFRDAIDALTQSQKWDKLGVALHFVDAGGETLNTGSASGKMFLTLSAAFAEMERNLISERTSSSLQHKKENMVVYSPIPFGYKEKAAKDGKNRLLIEDKDEQLALDLIKSLAEQGWSLRKIATELTDRNIATKKGGKWYASTVNYILNNDLYRKNENG